MKCLMYHSLTYHNLISQSTSEHIKEDVESSSFTDGGNKAGGFSHSVDSCGHLHSDSEHIPAGSSSAPKQSDPSTVIWLLVGRGIQISWLAERSHLSLSLTWKTLGADTRQARAEERVAPKIPAVISGAKPDTMLMLCKETQWITYALCMMQSSSLDFNNSERPVQSICTAAQAPGLQPALRHSPNLGHGLWSPRHPRAAPVKSVSSKPTSPEEPIASTPVTHVPM